jgi:hypothetical protein
MTRDAVIEAVASLERLAVIAHVQLPPVTIYVEMPCRDSTHWSQRS